MSATIENSQKQLKNEENTKRNYITPIIEERWGDKTKIIMEYPFTDGRIVVDEQGNAVRLKKKKADYMLWHTNNQPLAIVEAKGEEHSADEGYSQVVDYAEILDVPFAYTTNGKDLIERDMITGINKKMSLHDFPQREDLWKRYLDEKSIDAQAADLISYPYYETPTGKSPRYYQRIAINRTIEAIARRQNRLLLVMATGTGKTFTAFQIIWRLWKSGNVKKVLFLADRNILVDQTMRKDFAPFQEAMIKYDNKKPNMSKDIYLSLYQQLTTAEQEFYLDLPEDYFDLVIVDECHRGSASPDSDWRKILDHFSSAIQIGMTATPKDGGLEAAVRRETEAKDAYEQAKGKSGSPMDKLTKDLQKAVEARKKAQSESNLQYFGNPIYTYSLKQGIDDGFLAPYKVISVELNVDRDGYRPTEGKTDENGNLLDSTRVYRQKEFDRSIVLSDRRRQVAKRLTEFMKANNMRYAKTILFCEDIDHAAEMVRMLENENTDITKDEPHYVMQITGDNPVGKQYLDDFVDPYSKYPVIAVTSKLMTTGVDAETCKIVALDRSIGSMTEFKQIIGRGTRIKEHYKIDGEDQSKMFFNILDFRKNYLSFRDPGFDGEPVDAVEVPEDVSFAKQTEKQPGSTNKKPKPKEQKVRVNGVDVDIVGEEVQYLDANGRLVHQNLTSCVKNNICGEYGTEEAFHQAWMAAPDKEQMANRLLLGIDWDKRFREQFGYPVDRYDMIRFFGYDVDPLSKEDRTKRTMITEFLAEQSPEKREVLELMLRSYVNSGISVLKNMKEIFSQPEFAEIGYNALGVSRLFGGRDNYFETLRNLEQSLYKAEEDQNS